MKKKFFFLPFMALVLSLVSCEKFEIDSLVGYWGNSSMVYEFYSDKTGRYWYATGYKYHFSWTCTDTQLFLIHEESENDLRPRIDLYYYTLSGNILSIYDSDNKYKGSYRKKGRD